MCFEPALGDHLPSMNAGPLPSALGYLKKKKDFWEKELNKMHCLDSSSFTYASLPKQCFA